MVRMNGWWSMMINDFMINDDPWLSMMMLLFLIRKRDDPQNVMMERYDWSHFWMIESKWQIKKMMVNRPKMTRLERFQGGPKWITWATSSITWEDSRKSSSECLVTVVGWTTIGWWFSLIIHSFAIRIWCQNQVVTTRSQMALTGSEWGPGRSQ